MIETHTIDMGVWGERCGYVRVVTDCPPPQTWDTIKPGDTITLTVLRVLEQQERS